MSVSADIKNYTSKNPLVYVTRDIERALGIAPGDVYLIVTNDSLQGRAAREKYPNHIFLVESDKALDTFDLLSLPETEHIIATHTASVVVFQNTARIERLAQEKNWKLLNPSAALAQTIEEKISQVQWLGDDAGLLPPHQISIMKDVRHMDKRFVLQFNHSHTGQGTYIINSPADLEKLSLKFPNRECRIVDFIEGSVFTANVVVGQNILVGNISYQITGLPPFTDLPFSTIGNDWMLAHDAAYGKMSAETRDIALRIGKKMKAAGWRGLFGIDVIYDEKAQKTYLLEINARQPASAVFESELQKKSFPGEQSIFEAHLAALLDLKIETGEAKALCSGSQIVVRVTNTPHTVDVAALEKKGFAITRYENNIHNKELFRIQSSESIIEAHGKLNQLGQFIASCIK